MSALASTEPERTSVTTGKQVSAARMLLGMTPEQLADRAGISVSTVERLESSDPGAEDNAEVLDGIRSILEDAGVIFIDERTTSAAGGFGVRLSVPDSHSVDTDDDETVQYPEMAKNGPFGAGG